MQEIFYIILITLYIVIGTMFSTELESCGLWKDCTNNQKKILVVLLGILFLPLIIFAFVCGAIIRFFAKLFNKLRD